ncbi:hypothetical protein ACRRTK_018492 [Alexandromys fortis]
MQGCERGLQRNLAGALQSRAALRRLALRRGRRSPGPLPGHLCADWRAGVMPDPEEQSTPGSRLLSLSLETARGGGRPPRPLPQLLPGGASGVARRDPQCRGWPRNAAPPGPSSPAPPRLRPAPPLQSGFCGARRPAPRLRAPRGGWLGARRGWRCAPPRLHCCAPGAQGSHAPRAPRSRPPGGSAVLWHGPRGRPEVGLSAEALTASLPPAGPRVQPARPPAAMAVRPGLWPAILGIVLVSWLRGSGESRRARSGEACGGPCARTLCSGEEVDLTRAADPAGSPRRPNFAGQDAGGRLSLLRSFPVRSPGSLGFAKSRNSCQRTGLASVDAPRLRVGEVCWFYGPREWSGVLK